MAIFKCKMCGGTLEINNNETVAVCEYCGTKQTLPKLDDDRKANLYDRANHFRRNNEFDKAMGIYEQILNEDNADAEAYWSLVLCKYGIEYVEDPATHKRVPTVNRAQFTSVFADEDYKSALKYADGYQRSVYEEEAKAIDEIQKGILAISQKEEPFDIFICYKETDNSGRRTPDSVLANDLYHQLSQEGFKVFFSRITLEDKLGTAYEPYIFAALNSSKVMVVLGTKPEYFNAVWVKNEWSRYLALIKNGAKKMLIPAYKDMDPYDLPDEFSHLQAQDMSKLGFMQDLIRGIKKIVQMDEPKTTAKETVVINGGNAKTEPLLKRAFIFLEDKDWQTADEYCEKVLDIDPENAQAYLGKLMAELHVRTQEELRNERMPFNDKNNYQKALRFGDNKLKETLKGYITHINERNENARLEGIYTSAVNDMKYAATQMAFERTAGTFNSIADYKDSKLLAEQCLEKAEAARKDAIYNSAIAKVTGNLIIKYESAITEFESILGWKDSAEQINICRAKIEELKAKEEADRLERERQAKIARIKKKRFAIITTPIVCAIIVFIIVLNAVIIPNIKYNDAIALIENDNIIEGYEGLISLNGYKDSAEKAYSVIGEYELEILKSAKIGDTVIFGRYEQDNDTSNGSESVEWLVLDVKDGKALVISKYGLDAVQYSSSTKKVAVTWETCTLRQWLNDNFFNTAFIDTEKEAIQMVTVSADKNPALNTYVGNATKDKIFLLSMTEANKYFATDGTLLCETTDYAKANGVQVNNDEFCGWWLRTPGMSQKDAVFVGNSGSIVGSGDDIASKNYAVRPAMWIDISE